MSDQTLTQAPRRYKSPQQDSARWDDFPLREGDIVVSSPAKAGTTWVQMICALLVFQTPELPKPLSALSPWLDQLFTPQDQMYALLAEQEHRRVIKTHVPLDGLPLDPRVSYLVVNRHPLDRALSMYHQVANVRAEWLRAFNSDQDSEKYSGRAREYLLNWCRAGESDGWEQDVAAAELHHPLDAWNRRDEPNVRLLHYEDLCADLEGQMAALAEWLGITVDPAVWPELVRAATFDEMKGRAEHLAPDKEILADPAEFFRSGRSGGARGVLTDADLDAYHERVGALAPKEFLDWLHGGAAGGARP
ncbi:MULTISPECIES: sulfotransferase domain-containing protein [Streptomyces]|uniref:sulfotransferase domain-containing protein n=1 Tax=Streptomyces TaxID=1883 RepID=UPI0003A37268|nr:MULTISPECIES: sulfotransferase domain-containing protein [Streptomyces]MBZ6086131.1 sulfotransferase domain-containing protein [Streptomyces olivaceus]MBZ6107445.1 sulfotransferase domain-containing protein [Streptomyces olivaceus]MBZ6114257.1 sulfotransferase domain-containing protein [Streptomyces olivaceus]MBZ6128061.1 sulfotransferase domain-containing protein [Streptomyces olivaceus]MBZ6149000.1 sulfotransferase domain-containing protein [Streptomyces olivaceus]